MTLFVDEDYVVGSDTQLSAFTNPSYHDNNDLSSWFAQASTNAARISGSIQRVAGPNVSDSSNQTATVTGIIGGTGTGTRWGTVARWNGIHHAGSGHRSYRLFVRGTEDWVVSRQIDGTVTWIQAAQSLPSGVPSNSDISLRLTVTTPDANTVRLDAEIDFGDGWQILGQVDDTSVDRITTGGSVGMYTNTVDSQFKSLHGDTDVLVDEFYDDPFDNLASGNTQELWERTDPYTYDGNTLSAWQVNGDTDRLEFFQGSEVNRQFGPQLAATPDDGYVSELSGGRFEGTKTSDYLRSSVRWDGADFGSETAYSLELRREDGWRLRRTVAGANDLLDFDTDFNTNNGVVASTVIGIRLKSVDTGTQTTLNGWIKLDSGEWVQVVTDHADTDASRITAVGRPMFHGRLIGQSINRCRAGFLSEASALPVISGVSPATIRDGDAVTISGSFPNTITDVDVDGEAQTIGTQSGTEITFTFALGDAMYGSKSLIVTDDQTEQATFGIGIETLAGRSWVNVANLPWPSGQESIFEGASPAVVNGDQCEYDNTSDLSASVSLNPDGTVVIGSDTGSHAFDARIHDQTEWGADTTFTVSADLPDPPVAEAGFDRIADTGQTITIDGTGSTAPGGFDNITWTITSRPAGGSSSLQGENTLQPEFTATAGEGDHVLELEIIDAYGQTDADTMKVIVSEAQPPTNAPTITNISTTATSATVSYNGVSRATSYEYRLNSGTWINVALDNPFTIAGLTEDQSYSLELRGLNSEGNGPSATTTFTARAEDEPTDPDNPDEPSDPDSGSDAATLDKHDPSIMKVIPVQYANAIRTTKDFSTTTHVISDIPWDDEYPTWNSGTSYNVGDRVSYQVVNLVPHIYEALVQTTPGRNPGVYNVDRHGVGHEWSEWATVSAVNAYRAFDQDGDTETKHATSFTYTIDSGTSVDYMAFMGLHADSVDIRVETTGGTILHNETYTPNSRYFADVLIVNDFPQIFPIETMFFITVTGSPARATHIIMGRQNLIGISQYGVELGFKDFSKVKRDDFGHLSLKPGRVIDTKRINVIIEAGFEHEVNSYMSAFTARRALFVGSDDIGPYIFGIARRFRVLYSNPRQSECEITVEGA